MSAPLPHPAREPGSRDQRALKTDLFSIFVYTMAVAAGVAQLALIVWLKRA